MNKQELLNTLGKILGDNVGNRMTVELANGIIAVLAQKIPDGDPVQECPPVDN